MRKLMRKRRKDIGLTQQEMAEKLGIARATYTNIERGTKNPSFKVALMIKKLLKCSDDKIFEFFE